MIFKPLTSFVGLALLGLVQIVHSTVHDPIQFTRFRKPLDLDWKFHKGELPGGSLTPVGTPIVNWKWMPDDNGPYDAKIMAAPELDTSKGGWMDTATGQDVFHGREGYAWYRTLLPPFKAMAPVLHFERVDDNGTIYLNGKKIDSHNGWNDAFDVSLKAVWKPAGPNVLAVLVENTNGEGGITRPAQLQEGEPEFKAAPIQPAFDDSGWTTVQLPHDYVIEGPFSPEADAGHGSLPVMPAWYRKTFNIDEADRGKAIWLDFDGVYRDSMVWLNGHLLGHHASGYTSFSYDIAKYAHFGGKNTIAVHVDPTHFEGWWYEGGGIYRHVWLTTADPVHLARLGTVVTSKLPEPIPGVAPKTATVATDVCIANEGAAVAHLTVECQIVDDKRKTVGTTASSATVPPGGSTIVSQEAVILNPRLWSLESPHLYRLVALVRVGKRVVDVTDTTFGIRTIRFDKDRGFFLNGKHVKIQGTCNHQDLFGVGIAVSDSLETWRVAKLKEMGCNAWRMSHNPPTESVLNECDRQGMLVMDENRHLGDSPGNLEEVASLVKRDRNHPSIIMWSMCNEQPEAGSAAGESVFRAMRNAVLKYDRTRPVSSAMNSGWFGALGKRSVGFAEVEDLMGVNYNIGVYDQFHNEYPSMPMFGSETASTVTTRGEYADNRERVAVSSYNMTDETWRSVAERPFMAGSFVWTGFDYKGEPSPYGWPSVNSHFGIMDMCGFPKDNYFYYQSWWKTKPIVHVMPHWTWPGKEGQEIKVIVFSNAQWVELFLNGKSLGVKQMFRYGHLEWSVLYSPGSLTAKGYDSKGRVTAADTVFTAGPPVAIRLKTDHRPFFGDDDFVVDAEVVDAAGHIVPDADNLIQFAVKGRFQIVGVGNGNPGDHDPDQASSRHAFHGLAAAIVRPRGSSGPLQITASSPGLKSGTLEVDVLMRMD